jgi:hypothetical protein
MARTYLAVETQTNKVLGQLPLSVTGELSVVIGNYSSSSFTLPVTDPATPSNWEELIDPQKMSIWVIDSFFKEPLWAGQIVDIPRQGTEEVTIDCITFEGHFTHRYVNDSVYNDMDSVEIFKSIIVDHVEFMDTDPDHPELGEYLTGINVEFDIELSGESRSVDYKDYNDVTVFSALEDWAKANNLEWTIKPKFVDPVNRVGLRKVVTVRHKHLGTITEHPNHEFLMSGIQTELRNGDLGGNVTGFSYSEATNGDGYATYLLAIGDGSGVLRTRSQPQRNSIREARLYPRVELRKSFSGIRFTDDAEFLAEAEAEQLFHHQSIVTLQAHDNGATNLQSMELGDSCLVSIKVSSLVRKKILRLVGWSVGNDSDSFSPTLAELGADATKFKRAVDPMAPIDDDSSYGTNPNENGIYVPSPDGGGWGIDPDSGPGMWDANGDFTEGDWGSAGSSGTITRRIVVSYDALSKLANLRDIDDPDERTVGRNSSGLDLIPGDYVATGDSTERDSEIKIIVGRERLELPEPTTYEKWRVHEHYPINVKPYGVALGSSFIDIENSFKKGSSAVIVTNAGSGYNWYNRVTSQAGTMVPPVGYASARSNGSVVTAGTATYSVDGIGYKGFLDSEFRVRLFKHDDSVFGGWKMVTGLPVSPSGNGAGGDWSNGSASREVFDSPIIVTGRVVNPEFVAGGFLPGYAAVEVEFLVYKLDASGEHMFPHGPYQTTLPIYSSGNDLEGELVPVGAGFTIDTYANGPHVFFRVNMNGVISSGTRKSGYGAFYIDTRETVFDIHDIGTIAEYLGTDAVSPCVSRDGMMYAMGQSASGFMGDLGPTIFTRKIYDDGPKTIVVDNQSASQMEVQRDGLSSRFYAAIVTDTGQYDPKTPSVWEVYSNGSVGRIARIANQPGDGNQRPYVDITRPQQMPDGSIMVAIGESTTVRSLYAFYPDTVPIEDAEEFDPYVPIDDPYDPNAPIVEYPPVEDPFDGSSTEF